MYGLYEGDPEQVGKTYSSVKDAQDAFLEEIPKFIDDYILRGDIDDYDIEYIVDKENATVKVIDNEEEEEHIYNMNSIIDGEKVNAPRGFTVNLNVHNKKEFKKGLWCFSAEDTFLDDGEYDYGHLYIQEF